MLEVAIRWFIYDVLRLKSESELAGMAGFFLYDIIKILLLLFVMITVIGFLRTFISPRKIKTWLTNSRLFGNIAASIFGAVTPFCSCSSIPIFLSFMKTGIPLGIAFSFLIASPIINEYLVVLMLGFFGLKITVAYILSGIAIGVIAGMVMGKMGLERYLVEDMVSSRLDMMTELRFDSLKERFLFGANEAKFILKKIWMWILVGVGVGALIHNYIPQDMVQNIAGKAGAFSVPIAVLIGIPMYGSCAAIVPIAVVLFQKGFPLGSALAFMMAVSALSLPEAIMLKRALRLKLIVIFFGITACVIIITGYLFNILQHILI